jgi:hypothetical protein
VGSTDGEKKCAIAHDASASCMKDEKETAKAHKRQMGKK